MRLCVVVRPDVVRPGLVPLGVVRPDVARPDIFDRIGEHLKRRDANSTKPHPPSMPLPK